MTLIVLSPVRAEISEIFWDLQAERGGRLLEDSCIGRLDRQSNMIDIHQVSEGRRVYIYLLFNCDPCKMSRFNSLLSICSEIRDFAQRNVSFLFNGQRKLLRQATCRSVVHASITSAFSGLWRTTRATMKLHRADASESVSDSLTTQLSVRQSLVLSSPTTWKTLTSWMSQWTK